ncbi:hypothetical protein B0H17DRAFT_695884 [Mycena rosella]|uniref:Uncharacterized protein n=1 Tax=Mycena rosella TaxID=1033263 RepID=A0AAD7M7Q4_MYCRO|nr:hypothetical protein B0H17DRAFT_695884 [Mycena rosella]
MSVIVDDHDPQVQYKGQWGHTGSSTEYLGTTRAAGTQGSTATFKFEGTSVGVFGTVGSGNGGSMAFSVDGSPSSSYSAPPLQSALYHQPLWVSGDLPDGEHTLSITQNSAGKDKNEIFLDYFMYNTTSTAGKTLFIDDADLRVEYSSSGWEPFSVNGNFKQTSHSSTSPGATVTLNFEGNFVSINAPVVYAKNGEGFNASVSIDGDPPSPITQQHGSLAGTVTFNNQIFSKSGLGAGNHTMVITALDDHPLVLDYFLFGDGSGPPSPASGANQAQGIALSSLFPASSQTLSSIVASPTSSGSSNNPALPESAASQSSRPLDLGAIIGGAVGGLAVLVLLILGLLFWRQRKRALDHAVRKSFEPGPAKSSWRNSVASSVTTLAGRDDDLPEAERKAPRYLSY